MAAPICPACGTAARLTDGREIYPHRPDLADKPIWACTICEDTYCGCHPGTEEPLGTPADGSPLSGVFVAGMVYTERLLAKLLNVTDYEGGDGSEDFDSDATQTLRNILTGAGLWDTDENRPATPTPAATPGVPDSLREAIARSAALKVDRHEAAALGRGDRIAESEAADRRAAEVALEWVRSVLARQVEQESGSAKRWIMSGSGVVIKCFVYCGDDKCKCRSNPNHPERRSAEQSVGACQGPELVAAIQALADEYGQTAGADSDDKGVKVSVFVRYDKRSEGTTRERVNADAADFGRRVAEMGLVFVPDRPDWDWFSGEVYRPLSLAAQPAGQAGDAGAETDKIADLNERKLKGIRGRWEEGALLNDGEISFLLRIAEVFHEHRRERQSNLPPWSEVDQNSGAAKYAHAFVDRLLSIRPEEPAPNSTRTGATETEEDGPVATVLWSDPEAHFGEDKPRKIIDASMAFMDAAEIGTKLYARPLAARPEAPSDAGWSFDMEAAPQDGSRVLLWMQGCWIHPVIGYRAPSAPGSQRDCWREHGSRARIHRVDCWQPIPAPPASSGQGGR